MNELSLILEFIADQPVHGRAALEAEEEALLGGVSRGIATDDDRARAAILMRDNEDALLRFVGLLADAPPPEAPSAEE